MKEIIKLDTLEIPSYKSSKVLKKIIVDFLFRFKDKHPFSIENKSFDVFDLVMDFLIPSGLQPSSSLYKEYEQSNVTKELNTLKTREFYNEQFKIAWEKKGREFTEDLLMSEEVYVRLKERYESRPPFVFFFNPTIQLQQFTEFGFRYCVGYCFESYYGGLVSIDFEF